MDTKPTYAADSPAADKKDEAKTNPPTDPVK
jgi:hypothetical protein